MREFDKLQRAIDDLGQEVLRKALDEGLRLAQKRSSGTLSYKELRRKGHPYAARHANPLEDPSVINRHTDKFYGAWRAGKTQDGGQIVNDSPVTKFLEGTRLMHRRPIGERVEEELREIVEKETVSAVKRLEAGT